MEHLVEVVESTDVASSLTSKAKDPFGFSAESCAED